jgi:hypothetical protein
MRTSIVLTAAVLFLVATRIEAGEFCHHCGCQRNCRKVCRLVCETTKEKKTEYSCECEDFCLPGPSKKCGVKVECDCTGHHRKIIWKPTCAKVHTRKKLVREEKTKEVPTFKWEVDVYCCVCGKWVKVEKGDKGDKDGGKLQDDDSGKSGKSKGGKSQPGPDRPSPDPKGNYSDRDGRPNDDGLEEKSGIPHPERLPAPPGVYDDRQTRGDISAKSYHAYYLGAEPAATAELVESEVRMDEPEREPRRLFSGLFGR